MAVDEWKYRGEGNSSLVIARKEGHIVYRLLKRFARNDTKKRKVDYYSLEQKLRNGIDYGKFIFLPWISPFLTVGKVVSLPPGFAGQIKEKVESQRPASRLCKGIDVDFPYAVTLPDFCFIDGSRDSETYPTFSIEIKPKWGYLPNSCHITKDIKYRVCRFCMHQYLKISRGKWPNHSLYCPIDLFSGNPTRVSHALNMLLKEPQNNLRLFKNDEMIHSDAIQGEFNVECGSYFTGSTEYRNTSQKSAMDNFIEIVTKSLLYVPKSNRVPLKSGHPSQMCEGSRFYNARTKASANNHDILNNSRTNGCYRELTSCNGIVKESLLPPGCVLHKILEAQMLDDIDIEGLYPLYEQVRDDFENHISARELSGMDGPFPKSWLSPQSPAIIANGKQSAKLGGSTVPAGQEDTLTISTGPCQSSEGRSNTGHVSDNILKVKEFLVSRSAKDCSIMVTIQPLSQRSLDINGRSQPEEDKENANLPENEFFCEQSGSLFHCSVNVIDLDPKPFDKIPYYQTEDNEVVQHFMKKNKIVM